MDAFNDRIRTIKAEYFLDGEHAKLAHARSVAKHELQANALERAALERRCAAAKSYLQAMPPHTAGWAFPVVAAIGVVVLLLDMPGAWMSALSLVSGDFVFTISTAIAIVVLACLIGAIIGTLARKHREPGRMTLPHRVFLLLFLIAATQVVLAIFMLRLHASAPRSYGAIIGAYLPALLNALGFLLAAAAGYFGETLARFRQRRIIAHVSAALKQAQRDQTLLQASFHAADTAMRRDLAAFLANAAKGPGGFAPGDLENAMAEILDERAETASPPPTRQPLLEAPLVSNGAVHQA